MPFLQQQVEAQKETIRTLQQQAKISRTLMNVERYVLSYPWSHLHHLHPTLSLKLYMIGSAKKSQWPANLSDRIQAERAGFRAELEAMEAVRQKEIAAGTRPKKLLDLDVGYHQELEAANKRLEMDNRLMAPRVSPLFLRQQRGVRPLMSA